MPIKRIDQSLLQQLSKQARSSERKRTHHNLHPELDDPTQRLCVAIEPGSYIQPHRHANPAKWEIIQLLQGQAAILCFDENGIVTERIELGAKSTLGVELSSGLWHTLVALQPGTVILEIKKGPYIKPIDKDFAQWAPAENSPQVETYLRWFNQAQPGEMPPGNTQDE